jgi:hypothetical protein
MFRDFSGRTRIVLFLFFFIAIYLFFTAFFGLSVLIDRQSLEAFLSCITQALPGQGRHGGGAGVACRLRRGFPANCGKVGG